MNKPGMAGKTALPPVPAGVGSSHPLYEAVKWYGVAALKQFRAMPQEHARLTLEEAARFSSEHPLHLIREKQFKFTHYRAEEKFTGAQVLAVMVFGLFSAMGEDKEKTFALRDRWPIDDVIQMIEMGF